MVADVVAIRSVVGVAVTGIASICLLRKWSSFAWERQLLKIGRAVPMINHSGSDHKEMAAQVLLMLGKLETRLPSLFYGRVPGSMDFVLIAEHRPVENQWDGISYILPLLDSLPSAVSSPSLALSPKLISPEPAIVSFGDGRYVCVGLGSPPIAGVLLGPLSGHWRASKMRLRTLAEACAAVTNLYALAVENANLSSRLDSLTRNAQDVTASRSFIRGGRSAVEILLHLGRGILDAAGMALYIRDAGTLAYLASSGLTESEAVSLQKTPPSYLGQEEEPRPEPVLLCIGQAQSTAALARLEHSTVGVLDIHDDKVIYWFGRPVEKLPVHTINAMRLMAEAIHDSLRRDLNYRRVSFQYVQSLRSVVQAMDSSDPHTIGSSSRVARYARAIAVEMGISDVDVIELAGLLHDIGMAFMPEPVLSESGGYAPAEHDRMMNHTSIGGVAVAQLLEEHTPLALAVRHHHERWDGWGYPDRLKGLQIPLPARIVAVADAFDSMTSSRSHRRARPFESAISELSAAADAQFDPAVVEAFLTWWSRERAGARSDATLAPCWQMRMAPLSMCAECPVYGNDLRCWEIGGTACRTHGDQCSTCIVQSEYIARHDPRAR